MKKKTLLLWLISLSLFLCVTVFGQKKENPETPKDTTKNKPLTNAVNVSGLTDIKNLIPQLSPKSPNVAAMERYGSYQVNLFNGLPTIEIPIFEITAGNLSVPVKLSYHASGIKVTDMATFAGMGWSLNYGGAVTRQVKGLPDEINAGSLGKTIPVNVQAALGAPCYNEDVRFAFEQMASNNTDTERDLFSVSIPSKSNQFILKDTTSFQWLMPEPSKIKFKRATNGNNSNSYFELTDEGGNYYLFNQTEITTNVGITSWLLRKMQGKRPTDKILFDYYPVANFTNTHDIFETVTIKDNPNGTMPPNIITSGTPLPSLVSINNAVEQRLPKTIYFPLGKINFVLDTVDRLDGFGKALDKIEIYSFKDSTSTYELIKTYDLVHSYKQRTDTSEVLFLSEVRLLDNTGMQIGKYSLDYDTTYALPGVQSKAKDYWGYYNGIANSSLIPTQSVPFNPNGTATTLTIGNGSRETQEAYLKTWTLNKITYPTNGFTTFEFEANQYFDGSASKKVGGLRIKQMSSFATDTTQPIIKYYKYGQSEDGNGNLRTDLSLQYESKQKIFEYQQTIPPGTNAQFVYSYETRRYSSNLTGQLFPNEGSPVTYAYVTEYDDVVPHGNGKTIYEFREASDGKISLVNSAKFFIQSKHWNRGQLSRKRVYGQDNKVKYKEENTYQVIGNGTTTDLCGRLVQAQNIYQNYRPNNATCYSPSNDFDPNQIYYFEYGTTKLIRTETYTYDDTDTTKFVYKKSETDFDTTYFQPKEIRDYTSDGNIDLQRFRYVTDFSNLTSSLTGNALALYQMKVNNDVSTPIEVLTWRKNAADSEPRVLGGKLTNYQIHTFDSRKYLLPDNISLLEIPSSPSVFQSSFTNANIVSGNIVKDSHYANRIDFGSYDSYGQLLDYRVVGDSPTSFGYNTSFLDSVYHAYIISSTKNLGGTHELTTTFKYKLPLIGIKQLIAPNSVKSSFFYDTFGRLNSTQDHHGNVLAEYEYYYGTPNKVTTKQYVLPTTGITNLFESIPYYTTTHTYLDGLGRPIQTIGQALSPQAKDIVLATQNYDVYGRLDSLLTIYPTTNDNGGYVNNGLSLAQNFYKDIAPFTKTVYENSMLNRPRNQFGLGNAWHSTDKKAQTFDEIAGSDIRYYTADATGNITLSGAYPDNSLFKKRIIDEQGNTQIEITDNQGVLIQKQQQIGGSWLTTYYINDDFGRVVAILQPEAYALNSSIAQNTSSWAGGVFFYQYDTRGRIIQSHVPNGGFTYQVYDKLDRLALNQDAHQRTINLWNFTKYDVIGREILSGELTNANSRSTLQSQFDGQTTLAETFDSSKPEYFYYTNNSFPISADSSKIMKVNYYDNYTTWRSNDFLPVNTYYSNTKGLLTGTWKRYTENRKWLIEAFYYDTKGRVMESAKQNLQNNVEHPFTFYRLQGGIDSYSRIYAPQYFGAGSITYTISNTYGRGERKNGYSVNVINPWNSLQSTIQYIYNEIGQLVTKKFEPNRNYEIATKGSDYINRPPALAEPTTQDIANKAVTITDTFVADSATEIYIAEIDTTHSNGLVDALQTINYDYHIRGQLNCINCRNKLVRPDPKENDLFSMKLTFEDDKRYYDGNISSQTWKTPNIAKNQQYKHYYDGASRLIKSGYSGGVSGSNFSIDTLRYDRNGNIQQLRRNTIDNLSYTYNGNQLLSVTDAGTSIGFNDGNTSGDDYGYWDNGALKYDKNKGIDSIVYHSYLKKVSRVKFTNGNWVNFYYDANGTLLKRKLSNGDVWMYRDNLIMKNDSVYQISHDEGRFIFNQNTQKWVSEFEYRDHLGNLRVTLRDSLATPVSGVYKPPMLVQVDDRDPTGLALSGLNYAGANKNNFGFINRETFAETGWIDLRNRFYMPELMRFGQIDPITNEQENFSPYQYAWNNPVLRSDPNGDCPCILPALPFLTGAATAAFEFVAGTAVVGTIATGFKKLAELGVGSGVDTYSSSAVSMAMSTSKPGELTSMLNSSSNKGSGGRGSEGAANKKKGDDFEKKVTQKLKDDGHDNVGEQITVRPNPDPGGKPPKKVKLDNVSKKDGEVKLTDAKSSEKAPLTKNQEVGYPLIERNGGTVVGKKSATKGYPEGTKIPPTPIDIIRPKDL